MTMPSKAIKFLLVDDLEKNLISLAALLKREGLEFDTARSGEEALELMLVNEYALALLDVHMPEMDGFELAEFMRSNERSRHIPIIFLTAGTADVTRRFRGYEAGAVDFIQKPIEADVLRSKTNVFFDLYDTRRQITAQRDELAAQRDELAALTDALKTADQQKNRFLAVLGHELRNPIMALSSGVKLLEKHEGTEMAREIRAQMGRSLKHVGRLIEDLLDIARIDQGKISLRKELLDLADVLRFAVETVQPAIDEAGHLLILDLEPEPLCLNGDKARIVQIISNLLGNAAKYTPPGGEIRLALCRDRSWGVLTVQDNGVGIAPEEQDRIFEIFEQVDPADGVAQDGLGIGLALVKQLVVLHGGEIAIASSSPGHGSTFEVRLPITPLDMRPVE